MQKRDKPKRMNINKRQVMVCLENVTKEYRLGQIGYGTLNRDLQSWWARVRKKPDPNVKLAHEKRLDGDTLCALNGVSLTAYQGECVGIIGSNGAGKSTLLKLISRVAAPTSGSIDLYGRVSSMLEVGTGFHGEMTGRENIYLNGSILGMSRQEIDAKLDDIIEFSEVRDFIDTPVKRYSSGMYVKLAFSVAAHLESEIVIMDEVLAVGDAAFQKKCIDKMRQAAKEENRTVLYVSHNMNTVRELCDRCIILEEGKIVFDGDTETAISRYIESFNERDRGDLGKRERRDRHLTGMCRMEQMELKTPEPGPGDDIVFQIHLRATEEIQNLYLRLIIRNVRNEIVGMTFSEAFIAGKGDRWYEFSFPAAPLASGKYSGDIVIISYDGNVQQRHDFLRNAMQFQVRETDVFFSTPWTLQMWGSVHLSPVRVKPASDAESYE